MSELGPIYTADLFPKLEARLIELLRSLSAEDWERQTVAPLWRVKDVAAHLLDTSMRRLSMLRDGFFGEKPESGDTRQELVAFLNRLNADWVKAFQRISPAVLIDLLEHSSAAVCEYIQRMDPNAEAVFPVAWAGETSSLNWFDVAREYTERWHHQQQIRLAVKKPGIMDRELYFPVLDTFMRALPFHYRAVTASEGSLIEFRITGDAGGSWFLQRHDGRWRLMAAAPGHHQCRVEFSQDIAWRIFTKGIGKDAALRELTIDGDRELGFRVLDLVAVMA